MWYMEVQTGQLYLIVLISSWKLNRISVHGRVLVGSISTKLVLAVGFTPCLLWRAKVASIPGQR